MLIMSIETSCDETAAAVIENGQIIRSNVVASQAEMHSKFGGIIPEMAAREHMLNLIPVIDQALKLSGITIDDIDAIGVTNGPGLAGSLLVGVNTAKGIAFPNSSRSSSHIHEVEDTPWQCSLKRPAQRLFHSTKR